MVSSVFVHITVMKSIISCSKMSQQFANDDLFDAELGADSDGGQNGNLSEEDSIPKSPARDWIDKQKDNNSDGEAANSSSDEETTLERRKKQKKREAKKKVTL